MEKITNLSSSKNLQNPERLLIKGDFDFPVEIEYDKSQVTEQSAIKDALTEINSKLPTELKAHVSDSEQCSFSRNENNVLQVGLDLFVED